MLVVSIVFFNSCKKDDDAETCSPCHIALDNGDGTETAWDIMNAAGGSDFCGQELSDAEASNFVYVVTDTMYCDESNCALPPGEYGPGSTDSTTSAYEIHCEDHGDHDGH